MDKLGTRPPLLRDRVAEGGKPQAQRLLVEQRLRWCDPEVTTVNSSWELSVGSRQKEKPTVIRTLTVMCSFQEMLGQRFGCGAGL